MMQALDSIKMQIACLSVMLFVSLMYFPWRIRSGELKIHKTFTSAVVASIIHVLYDAASTLILHSYFKPSEFEDESNVPRWVDDIQKLSFITLIIAIYLFYLHMIFVINHEKFYKKAPGYVTQVFVIVSVVLIWFLPVSYKENDVVVYSTGMMNMVSSMIIFLLVLATVARLIRNRAALKSNEKMTIILAIVSEYAVLFAQMIMPGFLIDSIGLTLMMIAFFFVLENPISAMLEEVKAAKAKADAANAAKSKYVSVVSHELRTPMNSVVGMTDLLLKTDIDDKQRKYLENMKRSGQALVSIVNDILDSSKIEAGKMELVEKPYELRALLDDTMLIIKDRVGSKPIEVCCDVDKRIPENVVGDSVRIRQIIINLMNNSVKFTDKGKVKLTLEVEEETEDDLSIRFSVADTGQGMKEEDLNKLFKAFAQVDQEKNHGKEGTGLGLSISSDLVSLMGGQIEVKSEYGKGSEFFFTIKQKKCTDEKLEKDGAEEMSIDGLKVLLVDDTELNLEIEKEILQMNGAQADTALSGKEALSLLKVKRYDMIFTDYVMPEMSGTDLTRAIRAHTGDYFKEVPVIAITGDTSDETQHEFKKAGITDFTDKPVDIKKLISVANKWAMVGKSLNKNLH